MSITDPTTPTNLIIADDHPLFRAALRSLLETDRGMRVVRECVGDLIDSMRKRAAEPAADALRPTFGLTSRELEIVGTVVAGYPNVDIAQKFAISVKTVKHHLTNIFNKLGVANRLELALFAVHHHLEAPVDDQRRGVAVGVRR